MKWAAAHKAALFILAVSPLEVALAVTTHCKQLLMDNKADITPSVCQAQKYQFLSSSIIQKVKVKICTKCKGLLQPLPSFQRILSPQRAIFASKKLQATSLQVGLSFSSNEIELFGAIKFITLQIHT